MGDEEEEGGGAGWIVSFADLMTLLFAAFVVLYGLKPEGESKDVLGVTSSIREAFIEIPDEIPLEEKKGPIKKGKAYFQFMKGETTKPPLIKKYKRASFAAKIINEDMQKVKQLLDSMTKPSGSGEALNRESVSIRQEEDGFRLRLLTTAIYKPGATRLERDALEKLAKLGELLKSLGRKITIEGHTDSIPSADGLDNWQVSSLRAAYLGNFLIKNINFPRELLIVGGYADTHPVATNRTAEGRRLNRRIEIKVHYVD